MKSFITISDDVVALSSSNQMIVSIDGNDNDNDYYVASTQQMYDTNEETQHTFASYPKPLGDANSSRDGNNVGNQPSNECDAKIKSDQLLQWGKLRSRDGKEYDLIHKTAANSHSNSSIDNNNSSSSSSSRRDVYRIGRHQASDIVIKDKRVSSMHCMIYCEYIQARLRIFLENTSNNGTFVNDSLTRLGKDERLELKSGDEVFLLNPRQQFDGFNSIAFMFINIRDRFVGQRLKGPTPMTVTYESTAVNPNGNISSSSSSSSNSQHHIEDFYIIGDQIGSGMCGTVHEGVHKVTGSRCAVKIIDTKKFALTPGLSPDVLMEEARMMERLDHPSIVRIKDTYHTDNIIFIVMELVAGGDLFDRIIDKGKYSEATARDVMTRILSAVSYLHANGIIHRDLKPENILLVDAHDDINIRITDFGLAKRTNQEGLKTFCGTPQYFAPEVLKRKDSLTGTGVFPFDDDNLLDQIQHAQYSTSGAEWTTISHGAKHLVRSMMCLRPEMRITVDEAINHPWMKGQPVPFNYTSKGNSNSSSTSKANGTTTTTTSSVAASNSSDRKAADDNRRKKTSVASGNMVTNIVTNINNGSSSSRNSNDVRMGEVDGCTKKPANSLFWSIKTGMKDALAAAALPAADATLSSSCSSSSSSGITSSIAVQQHVMAAAPVPTKVVPIPMENAKELSDDEIEDFADDSDSARASTGTSRKGKKRNRSSISSSAISGIGTLQAAWSKASSHAACSATGATNTTVATTVTHEGSSSSSSSNSTLLTKENSKDIVNCDTASAVAAAATPPVANASKATATTGGKASRKLRQPYTTLIQLFASK